MFSLFQIILAAVVEEFSALGGSADKLGTAVFAESKTAQQIIAADRARVTNFWRALPQNLLHPLKQGFVNYGRVRVFYTNHRMIRGSAFHVAIAVAIKQRIARVGFIREHGIQNGLAPQFPLTCAQPFRIQGFGNFLRAHTVQRHFEDAFRNRRFGFLYCELGFFLFADFHFHDPITKRRDGTIQETL
ncbi:MAG: hypothetical protein ABSA12_09890 [Verrucomicrobiia bacterium]